MQALGPRTFKNIAQPVDVFAIVPADRGAGPGVTAPNAVDLRQEIRFCTAPDGVQLAYSMIGQGPPLMKTGNWMTHLEFDLESPIWRHLYRELAKDHTLIRYDARGNGLSDRTVDEISFDAFVSDLETVVDAAGIRRFALLGISQGCCVSIAYAVRHPERVSHLILYGGYALGTNKRARTAAEKEEEAAILTLMRVGWARRTRPSASCSPHSSYPARPRSRPTGSTSCSASRYRRRWPCGCARRTGRTMSPRCSRG